jgi:hypothetical protein
MSRFCHNPRNRVYLSSNTEVGSAFEWCERVPWWMKNMRLVSYGPKIAYRAVVRTRSAFMTVDLDERFRIGHDPTCAATYLNAKTMAAG